MIDCFWLHDPQVDPMLGWDPGFVSSVYTYLNGWMTGNDDSGSAWKEAVVS